MLVRQECRPVVRMEAGPKNSSQAEARLWMLWIMLSTVVGRMIDWFVAFSRSLSDNPVPSFDFRWRIIASLNPLDDRGDGFPNRRLQKLLGVSALSHRNISVEKCGGKWCGDCHRALELCLKGVLEVYLCVWS